MNATMVKAMILLMMVAAVAFLFLSDDAANDRFRGASVPRRLQRRRSRPVGSVDSADSGDSADSADSADSVDPADSVDSVDSGDSGDSAVPVPAPIPVPATLPVPAPQCETVTITCPPRPGASSADPELAAFPPVKIERSLGPHLFPGDQAVEPATMSGIQNECGNKKFNYLTFLDGQTTRVRYFPSEMSVGDMLWTDIASNKLDEEDIDQYSDLYIDPDSGINDMADDEETYAAFISWINAQFSDTDGDALQGLNGCMLWTTMDSPLQENFRIDCYKKLCGLPRDYRGSIGETKE